MRILLVRHGESEGNVDERAYVEKGDQNVELTDDGWRQAIGTGEFLRSLFRDQAHWPVLYLSPYVRTQQTLSGILHGIGDDVFEDEPVLRGDARLVEKSFGATNILSFPPDGIDPDFAEQYRRISDAAYKVDPFTTANPMGDSTKDNLVAVKGFIDGTFLRQWDSGSEDFLFVVHGAVIRSFVLSWAHTHMQKRGDIAAPGNGDVIAIEGENGNWTIKKIYDGQKGIEVDIDLLEGVEPLRIEDLPPVPRHLLDHDDCDHDPPALG